MSRVALATRSAVPTVTKPRIGMHEVGMYYGGSTSTGPATDLNYIHGILSRGAINWLSHEQTQGNYTWGNLDTAINNIWNLGNIPSIASIASAPSWANGGDSNEWVVPWTGSQGTWDTFCSRYAAFCGQVAARYGGKLYYEIWNEPNDQYFWLPAPGGNKTLWKSRYAQLFSTARTAILNAYSSAIVMLGGFTGLVYIGSSGIPGVECFNAFMNGGLQFEYAGIHPYTDQAGTTNAGDPADHIAFTANYDDAVAVYNVFADQQAYSNTGLFFTECGWFPDGIGATTKADYLETICIRADSGFESQIPQGIIKGVALFLDRDQSPDLPTHGLFSSTGTPKTAANRIRDYLSNHPRT